MKLSDYMQRHDISPDAFADLLGDVSASGVRKWANEERIPRKDQIERIAHITRGEVMPNDFFSLPLSGDAQADPAASQAGVGSLREAAE